MNVQSDYNSTSPNAIMECTEISLTVPHKTVQALLENEVRAVGFFEPRL
jgi:hypothetical protein